MTQSPTLADSIARHERFHAADPGNALLLRALGDLYHQGGEFDKALGAYARLLGRTPGDSSTRSRIAGVYISQHRFEDAERELRALINGASTPGSEPAPVLQHNLGVALYHQRRWAEAIAAFRAARDEGLVEPDNLRYLAYALHYTGDTAQALETCNAWLKLAPTAPAAGYRALLLMDEGDMAAAVQGAREVIEHDPENGNANLVLGMWSAERQQIDDAANRFERLTRAEPDNGRAWLGLALVQLYRQEHEAAIASFKRALDYMPANAGTIVALGWAQFAHNLIHEAEATFREAIRIERNFGEAHGGLAITLVWQNRREEARREIATARRLDPKGFGMIYARSVLMALEGKRDQGEQLLAQTLERSLRPDGPSLMDNIRVFLRSQTAIPGRPIKRLPLRR